MKKQSPSPAHSVRYEMIDRLHAQLMDLIDEAGRFLHRYRESDLQEFEPEIIRFYAIQSMRLSTRLMQTACLLMLSRAERDGDMEKQDAIREKHKIKLETVLPDKNHLAWKLLPKAFFVLNQKSIFLAGRTACLALQDTAKQMDRDPAHENMPRARLRQLHHAFAAYADRKG